MQRRLVYPHLSCCHCTDLYIRDRNSLSGPMGAPWQKAAFERRRRGHGMVLSELGPLVGGIKAGTTASLQVRTAALK